MAGNRGRLPAIIALHGKKELFNDILWLKKSRAIGARNGDVYGKE